MEDPKKERADTAGSGGHSGERTRHQDRERLRDGAEEPLLQREGDAAEHYAMEEARYSREPESMPDGVAEAKEAALDGEDDDSGKEGGRS